jgi:AraC-like DNA-binding protein
MKMALIALLITLVYCPMVSGYFLKSPAHFSVINSNWVKLELGMDSLDGIPDSVRFLAHYGMPIEGFISRDLGVLTKPPFETFFDCKLLHDKSVGAIGFWGIVYKKGKQDTVGKRKKPLLGNWVGIDRNPDLRRLSCHATYAKVPGSDRKDTLSLARFSGDNNQVEFSVSWDRDSLYILIAVKDQNLVCGSVGTSDYGTIKDFFLNLWEWDCIEISLDMKHNHNIIRALDDFEMLISIGGLHQGNVWDLRKDIYQHWGDSIGKTVTLHGTLNQDLDRDSGYTIETALPWRMMGYSPKPGDTLGFDIFVKDVDSKGGFVSFASWSGVEATNNDNPSEWGNLVLDEPASLLSVKYFIIAFILILIFTVMRQLDKKRKRQTGPAQKRFESSPLIQKVMEFIKDNLEDEHLDSQAVAKAVNLSGPYLGRIIKKETGKSFPEFLNTLRVDQAKKLMQETQLTISEIAFKVGYSSLDRFGQVFQQFERMPPSQFRKNLHKPE